MKSLDGRALRGSCIGKNGFHDVVNNSAAVINLSVLSMFSFKSASCLLTRTVVGPLVRNTLTSRKPGLPLVGRTSPGNPWRRGLTAAARAANHFGHRARGVCGSGSSRPARCRLCLCYHVASAGAGTELRAVHKDQHTMKMKGKAPSLPAKSRMCAYDYMWDNVGRCS